VLKNFQVATMLRKCSGNQQAGTAEKSTNILSKKRKKNGREVFMKPQKEICRKVVTRQLTQKIRGEVPGELWRKV
jgi:hypothetical protein